MKTDFDNSASNMFDPDLFNQMRWGIKAEIKLTPPPKNILTSVKYV